MAEPVKLSQKERFKAIARVAKIVYKAAPVAVFLQVSTSIINAVLPIVTTFFAAQTTTALAEAYSGDETATGRVFMYLTLTAVLGIVTTVWTTISNYITQLLQYRVQEAISSQMYHHFLRLDFWRYDDKDTVDTYDKASYFSTTLQWIFQRLADLLAHFITVLAGVIALTLVNWWLGIILIIAIIPGVVIQLQLSRLQAAHWKKNVDTRRSIGIIEWDLLRQPDLMAELRLYNMAKYLISLRTKLRDKDEKARVEFERQYIAKRLAAQGLEAAAEVVALVWTVMQIINHALPIGHFIYVQQVVSRALSGVGSFINSINTLDEDLANLVEYQKFIDMPEAHGNGQKLPKMKDAIRIENISFTYHNSDREILKDVSFEIKKGQHIAIVGENGAGKSTLIKLIAGLYTPNSGHVYVDDNDLRDFDVASWHNELAVLQQKSIGFGFATARENVFYGDTATKFDQKRFDAAIDLAEARGFLEKLPQGVNNYVIPWMEDDDGHKGTDLSGGQWQRLALARNFYRDSSVVILDEPTSAIDALAEARIFKHLFALKDKTIITISHRLSTVKKADWIYMMKDGQIVEQGTYQTLLEKKGEFYTMFESQL